MDLERWRRHHDHERDASTGGRVQKSADLLESRAGRLSAAQPVSPQPQEELLFQVKNRPQGFFYRARRRTAHVSSTRGQGRLRPEIPWLRHYRDLVATRRRGFRACHHCPPLTTGQTVVVRWKAPKTRYRVWTKLGADGESGAAFHGNDGFTADKAGGILPMRLAQALHRGNFCRRPGWPRQRWQDGIVPDPSTMLPSLYSLGGLGSQGHSAGIPGNYVP